MAAGCSALHGRRGREVPNYDFACFMDHEFEVFLAPQRLKSLDLGTFVLPCQECGAPAKWKPSANMAPEFKAFTHENLGPAPVRVESREHYRRLLQATDSYGPYVEPGSPHARSMIDQAEERRAKEQSDGNAA